MIFVRYVSSLLCFLADSLRTVPTSASFGVIVVRDQGE